MPRWEKARNVWDKLGRAVKGFSTALKETGVRKEVGFLIFAFVSVPFYPLPLMSKFILIFSAFLPLFAELLNSAIEKAVDTATREFNITAKKSKDIASAFVYGVILWTLALWGSVFYLALS